MYLVRVDLREEKQKKQEILKGRPGGGLNEGVERKECWTDGK